LIGPDENGNTLLVFQLWWPKKLMTLQADRKGSRFGCKTATLEMVGALLPFLLIPQKLKNQHVVVKVDNMACMYSCENHYMKGDVSTADNLSRKSTTGADSKTSKRPQS
jgi:hypothetical protein